MKPKDPTGFSWSGLFIVTAISFFLFSGFIKLINGSSIHSSMFFKIGMVSLVLCVLSYIFTSADRSPSKKENKLSPSSSDQD
jgi:hypothetical protein